MAAPPLAEIYVDAIKELTARFRFPDADNLITAPSDLEQQVAIFDAVQEINTLPPETTHTLASIYDEYADPRLKMLLFLGAGKNIITTLVADWTANGYSLALEEFNVEDRLDRYKNLLDLLSQQFTERLTNYKTASQKHIRGAYQGTNPLIRYRSGLLANPAARRF